MLVDSVEIHVKAGRGGDGCVSFRREKFAPRGGPDGGDGGDGGSVVFRAVEDVDTLYEYSLKKQWHARNGEPGFGKKMAGRKGADLLLRVPPGTMVFDRDTGVMLKDFSQLGEEVPLARGGRGGRGNSHFARSDHQTPYEMERGLDGEERWLRLELKIIADVGIVGLPNAGKSTLLSRLSHARPKIADYPFTTLVPQLGLVELTGHRRMILADVPGLIEGAHEGAGLGHDFLRHIERTRAILHLIDVGSDYAELTPEEAYRTIRRELELFSPALAEKPEIIAANKVDLTDGQEGADALAEALGVKVFAISGVSGRGLPALMEALWTLVSAIKSPEGASAERGQPS